MLRSILEACTIRFNYVKKKKKRNGENKLLFANVFIRKREKEKKLYIHLLFPFFSFFTKCKWIARIFSHKNSAINIEL